MSKTIGFIGVGQIGGDVAQLAIKAGYNVVLSNSRGPETLSNIIETLGSNAKASTAQEIADDDSIDTIVLSIPLIVIPQLLPALNLKDKLVLDTSNYYPFRDGQIDALDKNQLTTSEYVRQYLDSSNQYVKAFNNVDFIRLKINATQDKSKQNLLLIAGDDKSANTKAEKFINDLGYKVYDTGKISESWRFEPQTPFYLVPYFVAPPEGSSLGEAQEYIKKTPSQIITKEKAEELLASATRLTKVGGVIEGGEDVLKSLVFESYMKAAQEKNGSNTASLPF